MWGTFPPPGLSTHPMRRALHRCIRWLVVETECFSRSCWELPLKIYSAKTIECPPPTSPIHMPSITATSWHMLTVTSPLIASLPMKQRTMTDVVHVLSRWVCMTHRLRWTQYWVYLRGLTIAFSPFIEQLINSLPKKQVGNTSYTGVSTSQQAVYTRSTKAKWKAGLKGRKWHWSRGR